ncbi:hypothetical protein EV360DRAFT_67248 [Lentinula raphanica]|nr:hypothetical protein EV360DRAFT_67248 [Lentinula raphanica]
MTSYAFATVDGTCSYQDSPLQHHETRATDEHTVAETYYPVLSDFYTWLGSECGEFVYPQGNTQSSDENTLTEYSTPSYNQQEGVYSHHHHHHPDPGFTAAQSSFCPTPSTSYSPHSPQFKISISPSTSITSSSGNSYENCYSFDLFPLCSQKDKGEEKIDIPFSNLSPHDGAYYTPDDRSGVFWMSEMNESFERTNTCAEDSVIAKAPRSEELDVWTKDKQWAQQISGEEELQKWIEEMIGPTGPQDPSDCYPFYPGGLGCSFATNLSANTASNTPSDFTSSDSPLTPLELEAYYADITSTISPTNSQMVSLPALASSLKSVLPAQTTVPIIHAPRPMHMIDSSYFERLIAAYDSDA